MGDPHNEHVDEAAVFRMEGFMRKVIFGSATLMLQPHMIEQLPTYRSTFVSDEIISQVYSCTTGREDLIVNSLPIASVDLLFSRDLSSGRKDVRVIAPSSGLIPSYITFEKNTVYHGIRFKPGIPLRIADTSSKGFFDNVLYMKSLSVDFDNVDRIFIGSLPYRKKIDALKSLFPNFMVDLSNGRVMLVCFIIDFLLQHSGEFSLASLSEKTGYTPYYMNKVFRAYTGYSIGQYHRLLRVHQILDRFETGIEQKNKIYQADLSLEMGFSDQAHMIREFREYTGYTPAKYLKLRMKKDS